MHHRSGKVLKVIASKHETVEPYLARSNSQARTRVGNHKTHQSVQTCVVAVGTFRWEPLLATPCCNTSRATWSTPSEPPHKKPFFEVLSFSALFGTGCCAVNLFFFKLVCFISVCPCIPETGRLENTYSCCGFWLWSWLAAVVNLFVLNLLCFISVCLYPKRADCRTRTYREETKKTLPRRPGHVAPRGAFSCRCANAAILNATS